MRGWFNTRAAVVIAHGGKSRSTAPDSNLRSPALRMLPFLVDLACSGRRVGDAVALEDGDQMRVGSVTMVFRRVGALPSTMTQGGRDS